MKVQLLNYDELTKDQKDDQPNNGQGKENATYLMASNGLLLVALESDAMEPEDCTFRRDLKWIPDLLKKCYDLGRSDQNNP